MAAPCRAAKSITNAATLEGQTAGGSDRDAMSEPVAQSSTLHRNQIDGGVLATTIHFEIELIALAFIDC